jgi:hypothetical protein
MIPLKMVSTTRWLLTGLVVLQLGTGCKKDANNPSSQAFQSDCVISMSFEMETTTSARVATIADEQDLSAIDRIMALPHRERFAVQACYKANNEKEFTITVLTPENPIVYADHAADGYIKPDYHTLKVVNGMASYYDQSNNLIKTAPMEEDAAAIQHILQMVSNRKPLSTEEFTQGLNIMRDSGMLVQHHDNNLASIRLNNPDGSHCVQVLDKVRQVSVGNFYYDSSGALQSRSMLNFDGTAQQPVLKQAFTEARYTSLEKNIPMWIQKYSSFDNFSISFQ